MSLPALTTVSPAPELIVTAPPACRSTVPPVVMSPVAASVRSVLAMTVRCPPLTAPPVLSPAFTAIEPTVVCSSRLPLPLAVTDWSTVSVPPATSTTAPSPPTLSKPACTASDGPAAAVPLASTRFTPITTVWPTNTASVSLKNRPPELAWALITLTAVSMWLDPSPIAVPARSLSCWA